jgi:glucose-6-phosphate 1-dehydrogenase
MKADSFAFVLFGATGDLTKPKILPALYAAHRVGSLPALLTAWSVGRAAPKPYLAGT